MPIRKLLRKTLLWVLDETPKTSDPVTQQNHKVTREWRPGDEDKWDRMPILKGKTELVLKSLLLSTAHKREHHGCRSNTGIRGTTKTDRPNPLGGMGPALYEPIHRQGIKNPRGGAGCMDGKLRTKPLALTQKTYV